MITQFYFLEEIAQTMFCYTNILLVKRGDFQFIFFSISIHVLQILMIFMSYHASSESRLMQFTLSNKYQAAGKNSQDILPFLLFRIVCVKMIDRLQWQTQIIWMLNIARPLNILNLNKIRISFKLSQNTKENIPYYNHYS